MPVWYYVPTPAPPSTDIVLLLQRSLPRQGVAIKMRNSNLPAVLPVSPMLM